MLWIIEEEVEVLRPRRLLVIFEFAGGFG